jgi:thiamine pyrophosphate-dependent acetolactate synthase large subunit-like protein
MTGPEIAHAQAYRCNPVIVLLNNQSWEMLQVFFPDATYNTTAPWPYARLAELWGARGFDVRTARELRDALATAWDDDRPAVLEVRIERGDVSPVLRKFVAAIKERAAGMTRAGGRGKGEGGRAVSRGRQ